MRAFKASIRWLQRQRERPRWARLTVSLVLVLAAFGLRVVLEDHAPITFEPFLVATWLASLTFGVLPGLLAAAVASVLEVVWFLEPVRSLAVQRWTDVAVIALLLLVVIATTATAEAVWILVQDEDRRD